MSSTATVEVPLEYSAPDGVQIPLAVMRHRATDPTHRIGSLFFNLAIALVLFFVLGGRKLIGRKVAVAGQVDDVDEFG